MDAALLGLSVASSTASHSILTGRNLLLTASAGRDSGKTLIIVEPSMRGGGGRKKKKKRKDDGRSMLTS